MSRVLSARDLRDLRKLSKGSFTDDQVDGFIAAMKPNGANRQHTFTLMTLDASALRGQLKVFLRESIVDPNSYSAGLVFVPLGETDGICLVRVNGPHSHTHTVDMGGCRWTFAEVPHVHYCTERALQEDVRTNGRRGHDRFAVPSGGYRDVKEAFRALAKRTGIGYQETFTSGYHPISSV